MPPVRTLLVACLAVGLVSEAAAQQFRRHGGAGSLEDGEILVQAQRSVVIRLSPDADSQARQDEAVKLIYRMAERECALILDTIGQACELTAINNSVSANEDGERTPTIRAQGSFTLKVKLKS